ncbi:hypothetical protein [Labrys monachus]|uniref:Uncharacterized protein n=1 Tax=Labrys monachus TaxID=217067 RepID=A0ABU0FJR2_9HYPH|nr:hypothetical protein [Labrys monachus]MDQ0394840.1 hypothetical protein [Labrys monachus]
MSVEGTYKITVKTPLGPQEAQLTLRSEGSALSGSIENVKGRSDFSGGSVDGNEFRFPARISTPIGRIHADIAGRVEDDRLIASAKLPLGTAKIEGVRI